MVIWAKQIVSALNKMINDIAVNMYIYPCLPPQ